jgi:FixJ family two-component response regulator
VTQNLSQPSSNTAPFTSRAASAAGRLRSHGALGNNTPHNADTTSHDLIHKEVAVAFTISVKIVETYRARIVLKLDAHSIVELVHLTYRHRLVSRFRLD